MNALKHVTDSQVTEIDSDTVVTQPANRRVTVYLGEEKLAALHAKAIDLGVTSSWLVQHLIQHHLDNVEFLNSRKDGFDRVKSTDGK